MFSQPIEITSRDPYAGELFQAELAPDGTGSWNPETATVIAGALERHGNSCCGCCPVLNFFVTARTPSAGLPSTPTCAATLITVEEAIASGRAVFGDMLTDT